MYSVFLLKLVIKAWKAEIRGWWKLVFIWLAKNNYDVTTASNVVRLDRNVVQSLPRGTKAVRAPAKETKKKKTLKFIKLIITRSYSSGVIIRRRQSIRSRNLINLKTGGKMFFSLVDDSPAPPTRMKKPQRTFVVKRVHTAKKYVLYSYYNDTV